MVIARSLAFSILLIVSISAGAEEESPFEADLANAIVHLPNFGAQQQILDLLQKGTPTERIRVVRAIGQHHAVEGRPILIEGLASNDPLVVKSAVESFAIVGPGTAAFAEAVRTAVDHADEGVRIAAMVCLSSWHDRRGIKPIIPRLQSASEWEAKAAATALASIAHVELGPNPDAWNEWYTKVELPAQEAMDDIRQRLKGNDIARIIAALGQAAAISSDRRTEAAEIVRPFLRDEDDTVAVAALNAMRIIKAEDITEKDMYRFEGMTIDAPPPVAAVVVKQPLKSDGNGLSIPVVVVALLIMGGVGWWLKRQNPRTMSGRQISRSASAPGPAPKPGGPARPMTGAKAPSGVMPPAAKPVAKKPAGRPGEKIFNLD
ncbi:MAG: HEAT repeat domain-containing protein [Planctomycetes bacterium]|nr:HEAT repeat domain-containing protein [Planctomycetota bacterium]